MQCCPWTRIETAFVILKGVRAAGAFFVWAPGFWRDVSRETSVTRGLRRTAFMEIVFMHQGRWWPLSFRFPACGALPPRFPFPTLVPARLVRRSLDFAMRPVLRGLAPVSVTRVCVGGSLPGVLFHLDAPRLCDRWKARPRKEQDEVRRSGRRVRRKAPHDAWRRRMGTPFPCRFARRHGRGLEAVRGP